MTDELKTEIKESKPEKKSRKALHRNKTDPLKSSYILDPMNPWVPNEILPNSIEIGIDEAGRGPLFGRVYVAAAVLPKDDSFDHSLIKDSKRFHSEKKIKEVAEYIKTNAIAYSIHYAEHDEIDEVNILQANYRCMHSCINDILLTVGGDSTLSPPSSSPPLLLVDGNTFKSYTGIPHVCIEGGDNKYTPIGAASILAKVARDNYIAELCEAHPELNEHYGILSNKGYGSAKHMQGIKTWGITQWHRKSYAPCKNG